METKIEREWLILGDLPQLSAQIHELVVNTGECL